MPREPRRIDGYAPIGDYAAIGNERSVALVSLDGSIDWLCLPRFDSPSIFAALLDANRGGRFVLAPEGPFAAARSYVADTNVLETVYTTAEGAVRVTEAMTVAMAAPQPWHEIARRVEGLSGSVAMRWALEPRFEWGRDEGSVLRRRGVSAIRHGDHSLVLRAWDAGEPEANGGSLSARFTVSDGVRALVCLSAFHDEPLYLSDRDDIEARLDETADYWRQRTGKLRYDGPWREAVVRSALALQLLVYSPTGAITAAATTSLPEAIGGERNYDYRFSWLRDTSFTLEAMMRLGYEDRVHSSLAWMLRAAKPTHPRLHVFYDLEGGTYDQMHEVALEGYRRSRPVHAGNAAAGQLQLGNFGDLMQTAWLYVEAGNALDPGSGRMLGDVADLVVQVWRNADTSIWELGDRHHYAQGKLAAWLALDRAVRLAEGGQLEAGAVGGWREAAREAEAFIEESCWSQERRSYVRYPDTQQLDASMLLAARIGYRDADSPRLMGTVDALRRELGRGPLLYRYSGMEDEEGAFLACSFWLVEALARSGRSDEAAEAMEELLGMANDVGLFSEEIDPHSHELLGNFPQALTHLSLVNAAYACAESSSR